MKIAIVVHGRFHAFDLARELSLLHDVTIFTNYPEWAVERFGLKRSQVRSFWAHGLVSRAAWWLRQQVAFPYPEALLHESFGRWASKRLLKERWDVVHAFSGVSEEMFRALQGFPVRRLMVRGSAHIRTQAVLLEEEERRTGTPLNRPSKWMIAREEREYHLAEKIVVLSTFARDSFLTQGVSAKKIVLLPLGADLATFRPSREIVEARCRRILSGDPLRVLFVGSLSFQKGIWDMASVVRELDDKTFEFRFVGSIAAEAARLTKSFPSDVQLIAKQPQSELPKSYAWGDIFMFPTIQDGFAVVLAQAQASALPTLTTTNCCGPDIVWPGETGWVLSIRTPQAFVERLRWCQANRGALANMVRTLYDDFQPRTWADVARDFEALCTERTVPSGR